MEYFMGNVSLKEPMTYETVNAMGGVIEHVAQYSSEAGAIGYTFRYFLEELNQEKDVKMLSVDGVYPTVQTIENGTYPLTVPLVAVTRKNDKNENVRKVLEFLLSEDGQEIIRKTGYAGN
jgi:phosphate transport system substrate-binding protein